MKKQNLTIEQHIQVLKETIEWYEAQILPQDCGWMKTTISGIKNRIDGSQEETSTKSKYPSLELDFLYSFL